MSRKFLIPLVAAAFLAAPAFAPAAMTGLLGSATAAKSMSKSGTFNVLRGEPTKKRASKRKFITKDLPAGSAKRRIFDRWGNMLTVRKAGKQQESRRMGGGGKGAAGRTMVVRPPGYRPSVR
jgi:hypothetical protein